MVVFKQLFLIELDPQPVFFRAVVIRMDFDVRFSFLNGTVEHQFILFAEMGTV